MRCGHCSYLLFNLTQPVCPECGASFDVAGYRFEPGAVSFNCPHCDQEYYGNDQHGLPYPRQFDCVQCGQGVSLQQLRVVPKRDDAMGRPGLGSPWDHRGSLGLWRAWWQTFLMTLVKPGQLFRMHAGTSNTEAYRFAMISNYLGLLPYFLYAATMIWAFGAVMAAGGGAVPLPVGMIATVYVLMGLLGPLAFPVITAALHAAFIQLALLVLAPGRRPIGYTYRTALLAQGPTALMIVPVCGAYAASVWMIVTLIIGVKEVHGISGWRATIAVLWPLVCVMGLYVLFIVVFIARQANL